MSVKVCGVKTVQDAMMIGEAGADEVGLLVGQVYCSNDFISPEAAREIVKQCSEYITPVLVTHLRNPYDICELACEIGTKVVQVHSPCSVMDIRRLRARLEDFYPPRSIKLTKGVHANGKRDELFSNIESFQYEVDALVLDTFDSQFGKVGGTGKTHDWNVSHKVVLESRCPVFLAGGLGVDNVADAIIQVRPHGIDANSRLQNSEGFKDRHKVFEFVHRARSAFSEVHNRSLVIA